MPGWLLGGAFILAELNVLSEFLSTESARSLRLTEAQLHKCFDSHYRGCLIYWVTRRPVVTEEVTVPTPASIPQRKRKRRRPVTRN